jgi:hypothetical protein
MSIVLLPRVKRLRCGAENNEINVPKFYFQYGSSWSVQMGNLHIAENKIEMKLYQQSVSKSVKKQNIR